MKLLRSLSLAGSALARSSEIRLRLLAAELEYERLRMIRWVILCFVGSAALATGLITGVGWIIYSVDPAHRWAALMVTTFGLLLSGVGCIAYAMKIVASGRAPFEASCNALKEDFECLTSLNND